MEQLDARGLACPEPVIMIRKAMQSGGMQYKMVVDNTTAKENVTRYAQHAGYTVSATESGGEYILTMTK